jgi:hypothetical protein
VGLVINSKNNHQTLTKLNKGGDIMKKSAIISIVVVLLIFGTIGYAFEMNSRTGSIGDRRREEILQLIQEKFENDGYENWHFTMANDYTANKLSFVVTKVSNINRELTDKGAVELDEFTADVILGYYDVEKGEIILDGEDPGIKDLTLTLMSSADEKLEGAYVKSIDNFDTYVLYMDRPYSYVEASGLGSISIDYENRDGVIGFQWMSNDIKKEDMSMGFNIEYLVDPNKKLDDVTIPKLRVSYLLGDEYREVTHYLKLDEK